LVDIATFGTDIQRRDDLESFTQDTRKPLAATIAVTRS